jgi:ribose transport system permease protein
MPEKTVVRSSTAGKTKSISVGNWSLSSNILLELLGRFGILIGLLALMGVFTALSPIFLTSSNLNNILIQAGTNAIIAAGMTFVILSGEIDLSVGSTLALSSVVGATYIKDGGPIWVGVLIMLGIGAFGGLLNGIGVAYFGFPSFITTLSTMWLFRGLGYVYTEGQAVTGLPREFRNLAMGKIVGISNVIILIVVVYAIAYFLLSKTTIGRHIYAVGDNAEAARLSGVSVNRMKVLVFVISGLLAALGGVVYTSRLFSGQPVAGITYELSAIAAVVIGGTSLSGGVGGVVGTLVGAVFIATLMNGLVIENVSSFWQQVLMGVVVLAAVALDKYRQRISAGHS